jgi:hypothetical protein
LALKDTFSGPMVAMLQQILKSSTTFPELELELEIIDQDNGVMEDFSIAVLLLAGSLRSIRSLRQLCILAPSTNVPDADIATLVQSLAGHPSLKNLGVSFTYLASYKYRNKTLKAIHVLWGNQTVKSEA